MFACSVAFFLFSWPASGRFCRSFPCFSMSYQLPPAHEKAAYVEQKFDEISKQYDRFNDLITFGMHRYWKRFVARQAGLRPGERCLDLCCGTGDIARAVKRLRPEVEVIGLDFAQEMLDIAEQRQPLAQESIRYLRGNAMDLPFPEHHFDAVTVGYGLRNVPDLQGALQEIHRVLRPGGTLVSLDVGKVRVPVVDALSQFFFFQIVPWIGQRLMPGQEMFEYLPESSKAYPDQETLRRILIETGFQEVQIHDFVFGASTVHVASRPMS